MAALTSDRKTPRLATKGPGGFRVFPVLADVNIRKGANLCINAAGFAAPGTAATGLKAVGVADEPVDNTGGANGDKLVTVRKDGAFGMASGTGGDLIEQHDVGATAYTIDDQTVGLTDDTGARTGTVKIYDVKDGLVFVEYED